MEPRLRHLIWYFLIFQIKLNIVKIKTSYGDKSNIEYDVSHGLILGPLLFNIDLIYFFFECDDSGIASYDDDTTPSCCADDITELQSTASMIFSWFTNNHMNVNPGRCHHIY